GLTGFIVDRQPFWLAIPQGHRLANTRDIDPADLDGEPFVATALESEMGIWSNIRAITPAGMSFRTAVRVPDIFSVLISVAGGVGLGVVTESLARLPMPGVVFRKIRDVSRRSDHAVAFRKNEGTPVIQAFIAMLRAKVRTGQTFDV